ncbi:hypothetical protein F5Y07DRAFT_380381 [Xylaria sp. FL0933]|nr:hypothetical protein F5Y07DRAFT_380381 [Xylaria sp. FL0933]
MPSQLATHLVSLLGAFLVLSESVANIWYRYPGIHKGMWPPYRSKVSTFHFLQLMWICSIRACVSAEVVSTETEMITLLLPTSQRRDTAEVVAQRRPVERKHPLAAPAI